MSTTDPMAASSDRAENTQTEAPARKFRRRTFLVDRRQQLRVAVLVATVVLVLLVFLNLSLYSSAMSGSEEILADSPELRPFVVAQDRSLILLIILGSVVFLVGVFLVSILETHKTAGACVNISKRLDEIAQGRVNTGLFLRKDDNLKQLEAPFNRMCQALQERTWEEVDVLERLAARLEAGEADAVVAANELRAFATDKRRAVE